MIKTLRFGLIFIVRIIIFYVVLKIIIGAYESYILYTLDKMSSIEYEEELLIYSFILFLLSIIYRETDLVFDDLKKLEKKVNNNLL